MRTQTTSLSVWREQIGQHIVHLDFQPREGVPFEAGLRSIFNHEGTRVARSVTTAGTTVRDRALTKKGAPSYDLLIAQRSCFHIDHLGQELRLQPGDAAILQNWEPGRLAGPAATAYIAVVLPVEIVAAHELSAPVAGRVIRRGNVALGLLRGYIRLLEARALAISGALSTGIARHLAELALASARAPNPIEESSAGSLQAARTAAALAYIDERFADPNLSVVSASAALRISVRYLERLMEVSGKSFTKRVLERRLSAAHDCLLSASGGNLRISDIALRNGFSDISYFTRCFRTRYGASPSGLRR